MPASPETTNPGVPIPGLSQIQLPPWALVIIVLLGSGGGGGVTAFLTNDGERDIERMEAKVELLDKAIYDLKIAIIRAHPEITP